MTFFNVVRLCFVELSRQTYTLWLGLRTVELRKQVPLLCVRFVDLSRQKYWLSLRFAELGSKLKLSFSALLFVEQIKQNNILDLRVMEPRRQKLPMA